MSLGEISFLAGVIFALAIVPGPADAVLVARTLQYGLGSALAMIAGILIADGLLIVAVAWGSRVLLGGIQEAGTLFQPLAGLLLLVWGIRALRSETHASRSPKVELRKAGKLGSLVAGCVLTLSEPKALLFYGMMLPAFVDLEELGRRGLLGFLCVTLFVVGGVKSILALLASRAGRWWNPGWIARLSAWLLTGAGVLLLLFQ